MPVDAAADLPRASVVAPGAFPQARDNFQPAFPIQLIWLAGAEDRSPELEQWFGGSRCHVLNDAWDQLPGLVHYCIHQGGR